MPPKRKVLTAKAQVVDQGQGDLKKAVQKSMNVKLAKKTKPKIDDGAKSSIVDSLCPIANNVEVYKDDGDDAWECQLNQTDIANNSNKYFLLQLLVNSKSEYYTWFRWGRVGYNGQNNLKLHRNLEVAQDFFRQKFEDKTNKSKTNIINTWEGRKNFQKVPGKYELVNIEIEDKPVTAVMAKTEEDETDGPSTKKKPKLQEVKILESKLNEKVQKLIKLICDPKAMEVTLKHLNFDVDKSPLGKVTEDQIRAGYRSLSKISELIDRSDYNSDELVFHCNEFYTRIPHYFGMKRPPKINTTEDVQAKIELLEILSDISRGIKVMDIKKEKSEEEDKIVEVPNPLDVQYKKLNVKLEPLDKTSDDFMLIEKYIQTTHGSTHTLWKMEVENIFVCEKDSLKFDKKLGNRMLLFHGSRISNYAGILSEGLRIAPPEAPVTGYMFDKGVYFADMASKSANYCHPHRSFSKGILLLCEVALGNSNELFHADYEASRLPKKKNSVKGVGRTYTSKENHTKLEDGTIVPLGPATVDEKLRKKSDLIYNEYIVYDTKQIRFRYLAEMKFKFA